MTDITKCAGVGCLVKASCRRFTAPSSGERQSWFTPTIVDGQCDMFWDMSKPPAKRAPKKVRLRNAQQK
jgi:hypothetical protein